MGNSEINRISQTLQRAHIATRLGSLAAIALLRAEVFRGEERPAVPRLLRDYQIVITKVPPAIRVVLHILGVP